MFRQHWHRLTPGISAALLLVVTTVLSACGTPAAAPATSSSPASQAPAAKAPAAKPTETAVPRKPDKVRIGIGSLSITYVWLQLCLDEGIFAKNGLEGEMIFFQGGGPAVLQSAIAGELEFANAGPSEMAAANKAGADMRLFVSPNPYMNFVVLGTDKVKTPEDLKGKKIAISKFGGSSDTVVKTFLKKVGLEYQKDVAVLQIGDDRTRLAAMAGGTVDATVVTSPGLQAKEFGFKIIADMADYKIMSEPGPLGTTAKFIKEKPDVVLRMTKSVVDGLYLAQKDHAAAVRAMAKYTRIPDPAVAEINVSWLVNHLIKAPYVSEEGVQFAIDEAMATNPGLKDFKASSLIDNTFMDQLDKGGYIKSLYGN